jgi:acyl-CoA synthetase (AMP-forming)/AMP-acid ligase II
VIEPTRALALLAEERRMAGARSRTGVLSTYPSYLGELVEAGLRVGYRARDFALDHILIGGEVVTDGLMRRARRLFGDIAMTETYAMTETIPFGGTLCDGGHMHFEPVHGLVEVLGPETGAPARAGELGTLVATPFPPFRETTVLLRYDTRDAVRAIDGPFACSRTGTPATGPIEGKLDLAVRHPNGWTTPRDVLGALEAVEDVPLPARCGFSTSADGIEVEVVARGVGPVARRAIGQSLEAHGVPLRALRLLTHPDQLEHPLPLRCDLREATFGLAARRGREATGGARQPSTEGKPSP